VAPEIVDVLAAKLRDPPGEAFRLVVVLPRRANNGQLSGVADGPRRTDIRPTHARPILLWTPPPGTPSTRGDNL
jgi:hypothetical protein